jgi:hypothetical protein
MIMNHGERIWQRPQIASERDMTKFHAGNTFPLFNLWFNNQYSVLGFDDFTDFICC